MTASESNVAVASMAMNRMPVCCRPSVMEMTEKSSHARPCSDPDSPIPSLPVSQAIVMEIAEVSFVALF